MRGNSSGNPDMKALLIGLHNRMWNPKSGSYYGPDPGQNFSETVGLVDGMRSSWVKEPFSQHALFVNQSL